MQVLIFNANSKPAQLALIKQMRRQKQLCNKAVVPKTHAAPLRVVVRRPINSTLN
jgi:hypothetical protein